MDGPGSGAAVGGSYTDRVPWQRHARDVRLLQNVVNINEFIFQDRLYKSSLAKIIYDPHPETSSKCSDLSPEGAVVSLLLMCELNILQ